MWNQSLLDQLLIDVKLKLLILNAQSELVKIDDGFFILLQSKVVHWHEGGVSLGEEGLLVAHMLSWGFDV